MLRSQNGWPANNASLVKSQLIPGTQVKITVRTDSAGLLLLEVASAFDRLVEDVDNARAGLDDWGYAQRPVRGGSDLSNHASGTAADLNATRHGLGTAPLKSFTQRQIDTIHQILAVAGGVVRWGGDYGDPAHGGVRGSRPDPMHFEINDGKTSADCDRALARMRAFNNSKEDQLSEQFEKDARARWPKEDLLDRDTRGDLDRKQKQIDQLVKDVAEIKALLKSKA